MSNLQDRLGGARGSLAFKAPCRVATTANITLSGWQTIDGVAMASTDAANGYNIRVLVKNQTTASENGVYEPSTGAWSRAKDMDGSLDIVCGSRVYVANGLTQSGGYVVTSADPITIGTTSLTFTAQATADISFGSLVELTVPDPAADLIPIVDASTATLKNIKYQTLAGYNSSGSATAPAIAGASFLTTGIYWDTGVLGFSIAGAGEMVLSATALYPFASDGNALGSSTNMWSDLFLASGAVINFNNGDVTITHSANALTFAGAASGYTFSEAVIFTGGGTFTAAATPTSDDGAALGSTSLEWSDLFLASGGVINWNSGDVTITHASNTLTFGGATSGYQFDALAAPSSSDGAALGSTALMWSDLFLASGGVINWNNGDVTATHSSNLLAFVGASSGYTFDAPVVVGYTAALAFNGLTTSHQELGTTEATASMTLGLFDTTGSEFPRLQFYRSKNASIGSATVVASGDVLGAISWIGAQQTGTFATQSTAARIRAEVDGTVTSGASGDMPGRIVFSTTPDGSGTLTDRMILDAAGVLKPASNDGLALGTSALMWSDLFLASGAVINFNNGDVTVTHASNTLTFGGASSGYQFDALAAPSSSDGAPLGSTSLMWSDLFLASGGVINWNNGNAALTHSTGAIAVTGTLDVQQGWKLSGSYSDTWAGNQDNYNGGGTLSTVTLIRVDGGASDRSITGMTGGADGLIRIFTNVGASNNIVLKNETTSTAANRFSLGSDVTLAPSQGAILRYDGTLSRWTAVGVFTSVGAGSGTVTSVASGFGMNFTTITTSGTAAINAGLSAAAAGAF